MNEARGEHVAGRGGVDDLHPRGGSVDAPLGREAGGSAGSPRHDDEAQPLPGDRPAGRPGVGEKGRRQVGLRPHEHVRGPGARLEGRHVGDDEGPLGDALEERGEVEVAAAHVDGLGLEGGEPLRGPLLAAAVQVHDRPLAPGVHEDERPRAPPGDAGDRPDVDTGRLQLREEPLRDVVRPHRRDEGDVVPRVTQGDRRVGAPAAEPQLARGAVEVGAGDERLAQQNGVVLRDRSDDCDAGHARLLTRRPGTKRREGRILPRADPRQGRGASACASAASHSARVGTRPLSCA